MFFHKNKKSIRSFLSTYKRSLSFLLLSFLFSNNIFSQAACCPGNVFLNAGFENGITADERFPNATVTTIDNSELRDVAEWDYLDGSNNFADMYVIEDASRASEGNQFMYLRDFASSPTFNQCVGNALTYTTSTSCAVDQYYAARYVVKLDFIPFNQDVPGGGTGEAGPRVEHDFPDLTTLYNASGNIVSGTSFFTAVDWTDVGSSWVSAGGVTPQMPTNTEGAGKRIYISNDKDATCGMLLDNTSFEMLTISGGGLSGVNCGGSNSQITFTLNPVSNVPVGVPNINYTVSVPTGFTLSPVEGIYNEETEFTLTINSGDFSAGTPATIDVTITDEVNTNCSDVVTINNPYPCSELLTTGLSVSACNNQGTSANPNDDTYTFDLNPTGTALGATYNVSGDVTATGLSYGSPTTIDNGGAGFSIISGDLSFTITDVASGLTISGTAVAPETCSVDFDCDGVGANTDTDDGNPCAPNSCTPGCDFSTIENITFAEVGGNTTGATIKYILTNDEGDIIEVADEASFLPQPLGTYFVYIFTYENAATLQNCDLGDDIIGVSVTESWACSDMSCPLVIDVCQKAVVGNRVWLDEDGNGIQDAGERGVPGVVMELQDGACTSGADCKTTITDANGGYLFRNVKAGSYTVKVLSNVPAGLNAIFDEDSGTTSPNMEASVTVTANDEYVTADFAYNYSSKTDTDNPTTMNELGAIGDRVWNDANGNGIQDVGERGISNVTINLLSDANQDGRYENVLATTTTDEYGYYIFDDLSAGGYKIEVTTANINSAGFNTTPTKEPDGDNNNTTRVLVLAPGDVWLGGDFGYNSTGDPADIGSQVFVDVDGSGDYNVANDSPIAGVTVALIADTDGDGVWDDGEQVVATTVTAADGTYLFSDLPTGDYVVVVTDMNNIINDLANSVDPEGPNDNQSGVSLTTTDNLVQNFGYAPAGHSATDAFLGDFVFLDLNGNGAFNTGETGIEGVEMRLDPQIEIIDSYIDLNGDGIINNNDDDGFLEGVYINNGRVDIDGDGDTDSDDDGTFLGFTIKNSRVDVNGDNSVNSTNRPLDDGYGTLSEYFTTVTNENGFYAFGNLDAGFYKVSVETASVPAGLEVSSDPDGGAPASEESTTFTLAAGDRNLTKDFGYKATTPRSIAGTIWEDATADGTLDAEEINRFENVTLYLLDAEGNIVATTQTDPFGNYSFTQLSAGTYTIQVESTDDALLGHWHTIGTDSESDPIQVTLTTSDLTDVDFGYYKEAAALGNVVWNDTNFNGIQNNGEEGIPGVTVLLEIDFNSDVTYDATVATMTEAEGVYRFEKLLLDEDYIGTGTTPTYRISVVAPNGFANTTTDVNANANDKEDSDDPLGVVAAPLQGVTNIDKAVDPNTENVMASYDFGLVPAAVIGNRIWLDENSDGVQDAGERGVPGVVVELQNGICTSSSDCPTTITDANGGYLFRGLTPGSYTVKVLSNVPTGLNAIFDEDSGTTSPNMEAVVTITSGDEYVSADFGYNYATKADTDNPSPATALGAIGDRIWNDANGDGRQDPGERGIPNITVNLLTDSDGNGTYENVAQTATTDEKGHYIFDDLLVGAYVLEVVEAGLSSAGFTTTPTADPDRDNNNISEAIVLAPGDVWLGGDFGYNHASNPADIGSTIFVDVDGDGSYNSSNDLPLAGVTVALIVDTNGDKDWDDNERAVATTTTVADGSYLFADLPAGDYVVVVTDVNNIINDLTNTVDPEGANDGYSGVALAAADNLVQNFGYVPDGHTSTKSFIGDMVFRDEDGGGDYDAGEAGIEGVEIALVDGNTDEVLATTKTNENGMYYFGNLDAANYKVNVVTASLPAGMENAVDPDGNSPGTNTTTSFALAAAASNLTKDFGYKATTAQTISGTIWEDESADGTLDGVELNRMEAVTLYLLDSDNNVIATTMTSSTGTYSFTQVADGDYTVEVESTDKALQDYWHSIGVDSETDPKMVTVSGSDITGLDFGYYREGAALGNKIWIDYNGNNLQEADEPGLPGAQIDLEIDYNNDGTVDLTVVRISDFDGSYSFKGLLLDEDYNGTGTTPDYEIIVTLPDADMDAAYVESTADSGVDDKLDSDTHIGQVAVLTQGQNDVSVKVAVGTETVEAAFDFGYSLNCSLPKVDYAMTADATDPMADQTTDYFVDDNSATTHAKMTQKNGSIRSWTYCESGNWRYYYNPLDPNEYLFAIEHGSNTTEIEYVEVRVDDDATDRHVADAADATFVMVRDWHIKTVGDAALTNPVNIRFYFPPNEYKQMLDAAKAQATSWGTSSQPDETMVEWFNKPAFDPDADINSANAVLSPFDMTSSRAAASDSNGNNTAISAGAENSRNHIQFDGVTGFSGGGGTAMIHINRVALPVELSSFTGRVDGCNNILNWRSESELNFSHYELERKTDAAYEKIVEVKGGGTSTIGNAYQYLDKQTATHNYYRLKMVDLDGTFEYSNVVYLKEDCKGGSGIVLYPNPIAADAGLLNVKFHTAEAGDVMLTVTDVLGQAVKRLNLSAEEAWNTLRMDISDLPAGTYFFSKEGDKGAVRFIVAE